MLTNLNFLNTGMPWPVEDQDTKTRLEGYAKNKLLFEGKHDQVFTDLARYLREDGNPTLKFTLNWHKRITTAFANLLYGEIPGYSSITDTSGTYLKSIIDNTDYNQTSYEVCLDVLRYSTGLFKIGFDGERAEITSQNPAFWFPVVSPDNIKKINYHIFEEILDDGTKKNYLRAEIHSKGKIEQRLYEIDNGKLGIKLKLSSHPRYKDLKEFVNTGINDFLVVNIHNLVTSDNPFGLSDYDDFNGIVEGIEMRLCQIDRVVTKHSDPSLAGSESCIGTDPDTGDDIFRAGGHYWPLAKGEAPPQYVTWDGKLESAFKEIEFFMTQLFSISETSPILFGDSGKLNRLDSSSALRRLLLSPLSKVNRLKLAIDPKVKLVLKLASQLEVQKGVAGAIDLLNIDVTWEDGLPDDELEQAQVANLEGKTMEVSTPALEVK
jgi:hypothetical protein